MAVVAMAGLEIAPRDQSAGLDAVRKIKGMQRKSLSLCHARQRHTWRRSPDQTLCFIPLMGGHA
jgi:hypothetical protein